MYTQITADGSSLTDDSLSWRSCLSLRSVKITLDNSSAQNLTIIYKTCILGIVYPKRTLHKNVFCVVIFPHVVGQSFVPD